MFGISIRDGRYVGKDGKAQHLGLFELVEAKGSCELLLSGYGDEGKVYYAFK